MCGRFTLTRPADLQLTFDAVPPDGLEARFNVAPSQTHPVLRRHHEARAFQTMRWGLVPFWAKDPKIGNRLINARVEGAADRPAFRNAFASQRCLVPVDGFYEWAAREGRRQPFWIHRPDGSLFALAGLWERWKDRRNDTVLHSFTILTTAAIAEMADYHHRQPLVIEPEHFDRWLDPAAPVDALLAPGPLAQYAFVPVSTFVNSPGNDDPRCIAARPQPVDTLL